MKYPRMLWITALLLGWCFDFLFWKQAPGLNFCLYVVLCLGGGLLVMGVNGFRASWRSLVLLIPILFFAVMTLVRQEPLSLFLSLASTLGLMGLLVVSYLGGRWPWYGLADYVARYARLTGSMLARPLMYLSERKKTAAPDKEAGNEAAAPRQRWKLGWGIFRGILIALPIVVVFAALLSAADLIFAQRLKGFIELFRLENIPQYIFRGAYILIGAYALAGVFLHAIQKSQDEPLIGMEKPLLPQFLGFTEAAVVLGAVVVLFSVFVSIQFRYFFGGQAAIDLQGYTYSEYARRGFGELVIVAFFSLLLFLGLSSIVKRQNVLQRRVFSGLGIGLVALVGVMLVSAFQRLLLYEAAYGFSRLRMVTHIFMVWLGVLLAAVVLLELLHRERFFALAALLASIAFSVTLVLVNVDGSIVRQNVHRAEGGAKLDVAYLASLSSDAVPALAQAYQSPALAEAEREAVGAALACRIHLAANREPVDWRSFTLTRFWSDAAISPLQADLKQYTFQKKAWPATVTSPQGHKFECSAPVFGD